MLNLIRYGRMWLKTVIKDERGQGMVEYGLIIAGVALIAIVGFVAFGDQLSAWIQGLSGGLNDPRTITP